MSLLYLLTGIVCAAYVLFIAGYVWGWTRTGSRGFEQRTQGREPATSVSIILPARNEEHKILHCLEAIGRQTYPSDKFEIIVVDDHSTDRTAAIASSAKYPNLRVLSLPSEQARKKDAITEGIRNAKGELIITTDADCEMGPGWLDALVSYYEIAKPAMIVAPVLLKGERNFLQRVQGQEMTVLTACACASLYYHRPLLCSGANLAYEKRAFLEVDGFSGVDKTATGDDVFLMLKIFKRHPKRIAYLRSAGAVVYTEAELSVSGALRQRKRWASKTFSYGFSHITGVAVLIFFTNFLIVFSGIMSAINLKFVFVPIVCFSAKFLVDLMLLYSASLFFNKKVNLTDFTLASLLYPAYVIFTGLISPVTNYSWKGRKS